MSFSFAYNTSNTNAKPKEYNIPAATVIEKGEVVLFTPGTGVAVVAGTDFDDPALGVSAESKDTSNTDPIGRNQGTRIKVYSDPNDVFELKQEDILTLTGGSTTTAVISGLLPQTDDLWIGGYIEIVTCAADSDLIGRMVKISDSTGSTGSLALAETLPAALASGDTIKLYPGDNALLEYGWDLDGDGTNVTYDSSGGEVIQLVKTDAEKKKAYFKFRLHQLGNGPAAL